MARLRVCNFGMSGLECGETGIDDGLARDSMTGFGAWIVGRNMFGPVRGPLPEGWWGDAALEQARAVAGDRDLRLGDGAGEALFHGLDLRALGYACTGSVAGERATHLFIEKSRA